MKSLAGELAHEAEERRIALYKSILQERRQINLLEGICHGGKMRHRYMGGSTCVWSL